MEDLNFKKTSFKDIDTKLMALDDFCDFYGWSILKLNNDSYIIYDLQTGEIVDYQIYWKDTLIDRVASRALDYEFNEAEFENHEGEIRKGTYNYYCQLLVIYMLYGNIEEQNKKWLSSIKETFKKFKIEKESE